MGGIAYKKGPMWLFEYEEPHAYFELPHRSWTIPLFLYICESFSKQSYPTAIIFIIIYLINILTNMYGLRSHGSQDANWLIHSVMMFAD